MTNKTTTATRNALSYNCEVEPLMTMAEAAGRIGVPYRALQRAVKRGDVPAYRGLSSRKLVLLSEVRAIILATSSIGGEHV